jgi:hypothetical protein
VEILIVPLSLLLVCCVVVGRFRKAARPKNIEEVNRLLLTEPLKVKRIFPAGRNCPQEGFEIHGLLISCTYVREGDDGTYERIEIGDCWEKTLFVAIFREKYIRVTQKQPYFILQTGSRERWHLKNLLGIVRYETTKYLMNSNREEDPL